MPLCPNCGSADCEKIEENDWACNECEHTFTHDGINLDDEVNLPSDAEIAEAVDMQTFEDRINPCGDD